MKRKFTISVEFHKTGAVSVGHIRYGSSTEIARFFTELKREKRVEENLMEKCCPDCRQEMKCVGLSGHGSIYVCRNCQAEWVIRKSPEDYGGKS